MASLVSHVSVHSHKKVVLLTSLLDDKGDACDATWCYSANVSKAGEGPTESPTIKWLKWFEYDNNCVGKVTVGDCQVLFSCLFCSDDLNSMCIGINVRFDCFTLLVSSLDGVHHLRGPGGQDLHQDLLVRTCPLQVKRRKRAWCNIFVIIYVLRILQHFTLMASRRDLASYMIGGVIKPTIRVSNLPPSSDFRLSTRSCHSTEAQVRCGRNTPLNVTEHVVKLVE